MAPNAVELNFGASYTSGLQALSHALALNPQNPFTFTQFAETAYSAGDLPLALKMFLVAVDMIERDIDSPESQPPRGLAVRAWWGVKLVSCAPLDKYTQFI